MSTVAGWIPATDSSGVAWPTRGHREQAGEHQRLHEALAGRRGVLQVDAR